MRILVLTQILPYPPDAGPRVKTWHVLRYLAEQGHKVTLVSFVRTEELPYLPQVQEVCEAVHTVPIRRSRLRDGVYLLRSWLYRRSFLLERDNLPQMQQLVSDLLQSGVFDCTLADQLSMAQFLFGDVNGGMPRRIFDAHNAVYTIVDRMMKEVAPRFLHPALRREADYVKRYEARIVREFESTLAVTEIDRDHLLRAVQETGIGPTGGSPADVSERITVIPIAVDTRRLAPVALQTGSREIVTLGTLIYPPNADGIRWFLREVFPQVRRSVPGVRLTIIGRSPPADFVQAAADDPERITVTGYVDDLEPYLERAALMVVPVRAGSGMRVRILEALARGMPVVTTTVGLEGIHAEPGNDVLVADTPAGFAQEVITLLNDDDLRRRLAAAGRRLAETTYDWRVVLRKLDAVLQPVNETEDETMLVGAGLGRETR